MSSPPDRPFVPHSTPKAAKQITGQSDFRLSRPFVPGPAAPEGRGMAAFTSDASVVADLATTGSDVQVEIPPIDEFLKRPNASRGEASVSIESAYESESLQAVDELPPIEHFVDPLPEIAAFAPTDDEASFGVRESAFAEYASSTETTPDGAETDWIETDWQRYDWRSAAALGESGVADVEASNAWAETDWEARPPGRREQRQTAADAIASALDQIAERIRNGDLAVPSAGAATNPSAIVATLAALFGVRR